ncbi:MAG: cytochrome c3 family protein [Terriglobales bacterium]
MKISKLLAIILGLVLLFLLCGAGFAADKEAPATIILKGNPMGGVKFMHSAHAKDRNIKCETCHHASKPEKAATGKTQACNDCHAKTAAAPMKTTYKLAFHDATAKKGICIDCHLAQNAKGKKAPTKCTECHQKANA